MKFSISLAKFITISKKITQHLFEQSNHPHIKNGEVYVTYLTNISIDNNVVDAIGIFKSEIKTDFLQFEEKESEFRNGAYKKEST